MATSAIPVSVSFSSAAQQNAYHNKNNNINCSNVQCDFRSGIAFPARKDILQWRMKTVANGARVDCMQVWSPLIKRFETLSYLPPLDDAAIAKEIDYIISKGWIPSLEFDTAGYIHRSNHRSPGYYDGRYWTLWKLPMFGCSDAAQVLQEIQHCRKAYPNAYIRCIAFDNQRHVQAMAFLVHNPE